MNGYKNNTSPTAVPPMAQRKNNTQLDPRGEEGYAQKLQAQREALGRFGQITGASTAMPTLKETPNIKAALVQLNANIVGMNEVITALEGKLQSVMKPYIEEPERPTEARNGSDVACEL